MPLSSLTFLEIGSQEFGTLLVLKKGDDTFSQTSSCDTVSSCSSASSLFSLHVLPGLTETQPRFQMNLTSNCSELHCR